MGVVGGRAYGVDTNKPDLNCEEYDPCVQCKLNYIIKYCVNDVDLLQTFSTQSMQYIP